MNRDGRRMFSDYQLRRLPGRLPGPEASRPPLAWAVAKPPKGCVRALVTSRPTGVRRFSRRPDAWRGDQLRHVSRGLPGRKRPLMIVVGISNITPPCLASRVASAGLWAVGA